MSERQFVSFRVDDYLLGIDILLVREIIRNVDFTPVEQAPPAVRGLLNLRGQIITVFDLGPSLGLPVRKVVPTTRCIILKTDEEIAYLRETGLLGDHLPGDPLGLLVDGIGDVVAADDNDLEVPPANTSGLGAEGLHGVVKLDNQLLMVLALSAIFAQSGMAVSPEMIS